MVYLWFNGTYISYSIRNTEDFTTIGVAHLFLADFFFFFTTSMRGRNQLIDRGHHLVDTLDSSQMGIETNRIFRDRL